MDPKKFFSSTHGNAVAIQQHAVHFLRRGSPAEGGARPLVLTETCGVLGIYSLQASKPVGFNAKQQTSDVDSDSVETFNELVALLLDVRQEARQRKDWETSDKIRDRLKVLNIDIQDTRHGASCSGVKSGHSYGMLPRKAGKHTKTNLIKSLRRKKCLHLFWKSVILVVSCGAGKDSFSIPLLSPPPSRVWKQNTSCEPYKRN